MNTIVYVGNHDVPTSTECSYAYAFEQHGWHVERVTQVDAHQYGPEHVQRAADVTKAQLVLYTRTHNTTALAGPRWTDLWRALEDSGTLTASIHLDVFWGIQEREDWVTSGDPLFTTGTVFTADGRHTSERAFFAAAINHQWLPPAIDARNLLSPTLPLAEKVDSPAIVWVGTSAYHQEWPFRAELVECLRREYPDKLVEHGRGSPNGVNRDNEYLTALYSSETIVVGDSMFSNSIDGRYWSDRVPETLGRGGLLLHPYLAPDWYEAGSHYLPYEACSVDDLMGAIEQYRKPSAYEWRCFLRKSGYRLTRERDTYTHRAKTILEHLGLDAQVPA